MNLSTTLAELKKLSIDDRLRLVEAIWDSINSDADQLEVTEAQRQELARRLAARETNPNAVVSWEEIKTQALERINQ